MTAVRVVVATGCHLCPAAVDAARSACAHRGIRLEIVDIDGDVELERRYRETIPVVEVDGVEVARFFADEAVVLAAIDARAGR